MNLEMILRDLIAFKGNKFIYSKSSNEDLDPVFFVKMLSAEEMKLIDENQNLFYAQY